MRTIGLLGGMSWESSLEYYRIINTEVKQRLGGLHSAKLVLSSLDFAEIEAFQHSGDWDSAARILVQAAKDLQAAGAECLVLCTNTMHILAHEIESNLHIPFLHIADATAARVKSQNKACIALLGTRFTMEKDFYRGRLEQQHGLTVLLPDETERQEVHRVIYEELCLGKILPGSKKYYRDVISRLQQQGAEGVILGCTEIELLIGQEDASIPIFCTARIHAEAAVDWAL